MEQSPVTVRASCQRPFPSVTPGLRLTGQVGAVLPQTPAPAQLPELVGPSHSGRPALADMGPA